MPISIPAPLAPATALVLTSYPSSLTLVGWTGLPASRELEAFLRALSSVGPDAPTACDGWSAHELVAHLAAGSKEMARLVDARLALGPGADLGPTREFEEREAPFRAMTDGRLRRQFVVEGLALTRGVLRLRRLNPRATVAFTGWPMTADDLIRHGRSELILHRWDLVGSDDVSRCLLDDPALAAHAEEALARMGLSEGWAAPGADPTASTADTLLTMWGRAPARELVRV
ncbi:MAG TPA: maleylpyruvate isomerase N-terminal domain-containing protein [Acidimicrobiales bacterium]|jgi:hypothetical protein